MPKERRLNIALMVGAFENYFTRQLCKGAMAAAAETDSNLVIFPGRQYNPPFYDKTINNYDYQFNAIFEYAKRTKFDAFLVEISTIGMYMGSEQKKEILSIFDGAPVILLTTRIDDYPSVCFDNKAGLADGIRHLISYHNCRKIGFMKGPAHNSDSIERLGVYREILKEYGLETSPSLEGQGAFSEFCEEEVERMLDEHPDMDGLVFGNDAMAMGGYKVFERRGLVVGEDIHVMGFDDADFASILEPGITTVRADAGRLGYKAVRSVEDILEGRVSDVTILSTLVRRQSCGCVKEDYSVLPISLEKLESGTGRDEIMAGIFDYIFDRNEREAGAGPIVELLEQLMECVYDSMSDDPASYENAMRRMVPVGTELCRIKLEPFTKIDKVYFLLNCLYRLMDKREGDEHWHQCLSEAFQFIYRDETVNSRKKADKMRENVDLLNYVTSTFLRDILNYAVADDVLYPSMIATLARYGFESTYLLEFEEGRKVKENEHPGLPENMLIKAYQKDGETHTPQNGRQAIPVDDLFLNVFGDRMMPICAVASMLFSGEEQYGIMLFEVNETNITYVMNCIYQTSAAIKTIELLKNREENERMLKKSLKKIKEANTILDELSKSDELTQLLNRRGFLTTVQEEIEKPENDGKTGAVVFADMNNLKIINDKFGHDDGDFALRLIASILKESLKDYDPVIARFGGDEFCVFYLKGRIVPSKGQIRKRIETETAKQNAGTDKVYYVSVSIGICEFECNADVELADMLDRADMELYEDKKNKRKTVYKEDL
ncbi:MAG: GGDEF domain-containing protein [Lachnospiraceae bacterium]|nr:GGDEF domain-containing protein [Lachnospiraceae bacterium]